MRLKAFELIYGRVEPVLSQSRQEGYQTVFHSPALDSRVVKEIEKLVGNFDYDDARNDAADLVRLQYVWLRDGGVLLSKSVPAFHKELIDRRGRPGAFLCHCLILSEREFARVDNNPFRVLDAFEDRFALEPEELRAYIEAEPEDERTLTIPEKWKPETVDWPKEEIDKLILAARLAKSVVKSGAPIVMRGDPAETAEVLQTQFQLMPDRELRRYCTFSTHADNCEIPPHSYWVLGLTKESRRVKAGGEVDVAEQTVVQLPAGAPDSNASFFMRWYDEAIKTQSAATVQEKLETIQFLSSALEGTSNDDPRDLNDEAVTEFGSLFQPEIVEKLTKKLSTILPARTSTRLAVWWFKTRTSSAAVCDALEIDGPLTPAVLAERAFDFVVELIKQSAIRSLDRSDWAAFRKVARETENARLLFATSVLHRLPIVGRPRERDRLKALSQLDDALFPELFDRFRGVARISDFVCRDNSELFLEVIAKRNLTDRELTESLNALIAQQAPFKTPGGICQQVADLPSGSAGRLLRRLEQWGEGDKPLLDACRKAVELNVSPLWKWWRTLVPIRLDRVENDEPNRSSVPGK